MGAVYLSRKQGGEAVLETTIYSGYMNNKRITMKNSVFYDANNDQYHFKTEQGIKKINAFDVFTIFSWEDFFRVFLSDKFVRILSKRNNLN